MTISAALTAPQLRDVPRADGRVRVSSRLSSRGSVLDDLFQQGAYKAVFPRAQTLTSVLVNTSGGVTGGDKFQARIAAGAGSHLTLTTQAAERAYKALPGETGTIRTQLSCEAGARLFWLPQETIIFDGANIDRRLTCDVADGGEALIVEPMIFGRAAMGETQVNGRVTDRIELRRNGQLDYLDSWHLEGDLTRQLARPAVGDGATAMASIIFASPRAEGFLEPMRDLIDKTGGASLKAPDLLVARLLAADGYLLRKTLLPILDFITDAQLPTCWRL